VFWQRFGVHLAVNGWDITEGGKNISAKKILGARTDFLGN